MDASGEAVKAHFIADGFMEIIGILE